MSAIINRLLLLFVFLIIALAGCNRPIDTSVEAEAEAEAETSSRTIKPAAKNELIKKYAKPPAAHDPELETLSLGNAIKNRALNQMQTASMAFTVDKQFNVEDRGYAKVVIDLNRTTAEIEAELRSLNPDSITGSARISITKIVIAKIIPSDGLKAKILGDEEQLIVDDQPTTWAWELSTDTAGIYDVRIVLTAVIIIDGVRTNRTLKVFEEVITIEVTPVQQLKAFAEKYWQWVFSTLIIPIILWGWNRFKKRSTRN